MDQPNPIEVEVTKVENYIDKFQTDQKLPQSLAVSVQTEVEELLSQDIGNLKLTAEMYGEKALKLSQFSFFLQKQINKESAKIIWLNKKIDGIIGPRLKQQKAYSWEERKLSAIAEDDAAVKFDKLKVMSEMKVSSLSYLGMKIDGIANKFSELQQTLRNKRI